MGPSARLTLAVAVVSSMGILQAAQLSSFDRGNCLTMLKLIKEDLTKNYYDTTYRGTDVDKTFAEASQRIKEAKNRIAKVQNSQNCSQPTGTMR